MLCDRLNPSTEKILECFVWWHESLANDFVPHLCAAINKVHQGSCCEYDEYAKSSDSDS